MKSRKLNLLEPSGPLQACNRTALPFFTFLYTIVRMLLKCRFVFGLGLGRIAAVALAVLTEVFCGFAKSF